MACSGDSSDICGGSKAISVYEFSSTGGYVGCYVDLGSSRIMSGKYSDPAMTIDVSEISQIMLAEDNDRRQLCSAAGARLIFMRSIR